MKATLPVCEWARPEDVPGVTLSRADRALLPKLARRPAASTVELLELRDGVRIRATGVVGLIDLDGFRLRITPRFGDDVDILRLVGVTRGVTRVGLLDPVSSLEAGDTLPDLIVRILSREVRHLLSSGLRSEYVRREDALGAIRGRFLPDRQELDRFGLLDRLVCRFEELSLDFLDNQLLAAGLRVGSTVAADPSLRREALDLEATLSEVCDPDPLLVESSSPAEIERALVYDRLNEHYRLAHALSIELLANSALDPSLASGATRVRSFLINTHALFESFVELVVAAAFPADTVSAQAPSLLYRRESGASYNSLRPDVLLEIGDRQIPIDAKYKDYGAQKIQAEDLNQVYAYTHALCSSKHRLGAIVYPLRGDDAPFRVLRLLAHGEYAEREEHVGLAAVGIHIPTFLDAIEGTGSDAPLRMLRDAIYPCWSSPASTD